MAGENEPRQTSWLVFRNSPPGSPTSWVPPHPSPSPVPLSSKFKPPTSFGKGRGGYGCILTSERAEAVLKEPTSLYGGEGLRTGWIREVERERWCWEWRWWWRNDSNINRDVVDVGLKLHSPTITFDTDIHESDNKIIFFIV